MFIGKKQQGIALIEVLVTAVILAIGISGLGMLLIQSIQGGQDSSQKSQAIWVVQDYIGRIKANAPGARERHYIIDHSSGYDCDTVYTSLVKCADLYNPDDGSVDTAVECNSEQMAGFDVWTTVCGVSSDPHTYTSPSDFIINPVLTSECTNLHDSRSSNKGNSLLDCVQYTVTLTWDTKGLKGDTSKDNRIRKNSHSAIVELN